jgi:lysophospholipase L1-like esterase
MRVSIHPVFMIAAMVAGISKAEPAAPSVAEVRALPHDFSKWEKAISAFEKSDSVRPPPKNAVLFVGASTIVRWKSLAVDFPGVQVLNRGFGGNEIADTTHFADRIIFPYEPKMIFLRAGGNDIHRGRRVEEVFGDFKDFVRKVRERLPEVPIAYIAVSPSIARLNERETGDQLNTLIAGFIKRQKNLVFVDAGKITLDDHGQPRPELFVEDKLHFSEAGYKLLAEAVHPYLPK